MLVPEHQREQMRATMTRLVLAELRDAARSAARRGDHKEAEAYLLQALALDGSSPGLWALLSEVTRDPEIAQIAAARSALLPGPDSADAVCTETVALPARGAEGISLRSARLLASVLLVAVLLSVWLLGRVYAHRYAGRLFPGVSIAGVDVGGMTPREGALLLQERVRQRSNARIELAWGERSVVLSAQEAGLVFDVAQTLEAAMAVGRSGGTWRAWAEPVQVGLWGRDVPFVARIDPARVERALDAAAEAIERPAIPPAVAWDGTRWSVYPGQDGHRVARGETRRALEAALLSLAGSGRAGALTVQVAVVTDVVALTPGEIGALLQQLDRLGRPLLVRGGEFSCTLGPAELAHWVTLSRAPQGVTLQVEPAAVREAVEQLAAQIERPARDGRLVIEGDRAVEFRLPEDGRALDRAAAEALLRETCDRRLRGETVDAIDLPVRTIPGRLDPLQLELGIVAEIGMGSSSFAGSSPERANNIWVGGRDLNGRLIPPGEVFSLNDALAPISWEKGYQVAPIISEGVLVLGLGGGLCQVSTTVYRAALFTGLEIVERHPHQWRIPYYEQDAPPGFDATIIQGGPDLKFRNNTGHYLLLQVETDLEQERQTVRFFGTPPGWKVTVGAPEVSPDGLTVAYRRTVERAGEVLSEETFYSFYAYHEW